MRIIIAIFIALMSTAAARAAEQWQTFKDPDGVFSVDFPGTPDTTTSPGSNDIEKIRPPSVRYMATSGAIAFVVSVADYSKTWMQPENAVDGAADGITNNGTILTDTTVTRDGHKGRSVAAADQTSTTSALIFSFGGRVYQVLVVTPNSPTLEQQATIDRFNRSFHFLAKH
ncbi:MAG: hypothetical protein GC190_09780 [Alphaproteobacteria bacterium]|nr:hypothetical protein [Alphaproteobacteria bacterium]